jgi:hypothetical protein
VNPSESPDTYQARKKLKSLFGELMYEVEEEVELESVTNNMEEEIWPPYRADMLVTKTFIIELDSKKLHGTRKKRSHDKWRNINIKSQMNLKTVRLLSKDVNRQELDQILAEIDYQLRAQH